MGSLWISTQRISTSLGAGLFKSFLGMQVEQGDKRSRCILTTMSKRRLHQQNRFVPSASQSIRVFSPSRGLPRHPLPTQAVVSLICGQALFAATRIRLILNCCITARRVLCFCSAIPMGNASPSDRVPGSVQQSADHVPPPHRSQLRSHLNGHQFGGNSSSCRSTSGNLMLYNEPPIMWRSTMQNITALSTERLSQQKRLVLLGVGSRSGLKLSGATERCSGARGGHASVWRY